MEKVGFFSTDHAEPIQALEEVVFKKARKFEGLEFTPAGPNPGMEGMRRIQGLNRMDVPNLWRTVIRPPSKKEGPRVTLLAPKGRNAGEVAGQVSGAGMLAPVQNGNTLDFTFPEGTPTAQVVDCAVKVMQSCGYTGELQWTVREKGLLPQ